MRIRDVLLGLTTYPNPTAIDAVKWSASFAEFMNCRITAFVSDAKIETPPGSLLGNSLINWSGLADDEMKKSKQNAQSLLASFDDLTEQLGVPHEAIHEHELVGETPNLMAEYARLRDLTIIPVPAADYVDQWYAETVVFQSGRPVLVVPETISAEFKLDAVAVAWDFSRTAARAISDAIPFLERAKAVRIACVTNEKPVGSSRTASELAVHLSRHGVSVAVDEVDAGGKPTGDVLTQFVAANKIDLLVMGAYGHSRFSEFILGGATKSMMSNPPIPILFSH
jgi:nucleotide-binding universal stress UspA family protein